MATPRLLFLLLSTFALAIPSAVAGEGCDCKAISLAPSPVCGQDGLTYINRCMAQCQGVTVKRETACEAPAGQIGEGRMLGETEPLLGGLDFSLANSSASVSIEDLLEGLGAVLEDSNPFKVVAVMQLSEAPVAVPATYSATAAAEDSLPLPRGMVHIDNLSGAVMQRGLTIPAAGKSSGIMPPSPGSSPSPKPNRRLLNIKGTDNRAPASNPTAYPYRAVGWLDGCTATLIAPNAAITAGHCVYDSDKRTGRHLNAFIPAKSTGVKTFAIGIKSYSTPYITNPSSENDWAVVFLDTPVGNSLGWLGLGYTCSSGALPVTNAGYPNDLGDKRQGEMWTQTGTLDSFSGCGRDRPNRTPDSRDLDAWHGQSGSALWDSQLLVRALVSGGSCSQGMVEAGDDCKVGGRNVFMAVGDWVFANVDYELGYFGTK